MEAVSLGIYHIHPFSDNLRFLLIRVTGGRRSGNRTTSRKRARARGEQSNCTREASEPKPNQEAFLQRTLITQDEDQA